MISGQPLAKDQHYRAVVQNMLGSAPAAHTPMEWRSQETGGGVGVGDGGGGDGGDACAGMWGDSVCSAAIAKIRHKSRAANSTRRRPAGVNEPERCLSRVGNVRR